MPPRRRRSETVRDKARLIEALRTCRREVLHAADDLRPQCETDRALHLVTVAIDKLAEHLTGNPTLFHLGGSAPQGTLNGVLVGRLRGEG